MTIETKFLIGLFILMFVGSFISGFLDTSGQCGTSYQDVIDSFDTMINSFQTVTWNSLATAVLTVPSFLLTILSCIGSMILWNFCFFQGFEWLRYILISVNIALIIKIFFDVFKALKPFGS